MVHVMRSGRASLEPARYELTMRSYCAVCSNAVCARLFLQPLISSLLGRSREPDPVLARLGGALKANDERQDYIRATLRAEPDGGRTVIPFGKQDSSMFRTFREADCLIIRPANAPEAPEGTVVPVLLLDF